MSERSRDNKIVQLGIDSTVGALVVLALISYHQPSRTVHRLNPEDIQVRFDPPSVSARLPTPGAESGYDVTDVSLRCDGQTLILSSPQRIVDSIVSPEKLPEPNYTHPATRLEPVCPDKLDVSHVLEIQNIIAASGLGVYITRP